MTGPCPTVDSIRDCLEGVVPAVIATCAPDGTPNVSLLSQVHYVDSAHVALTYQFFNKTRQNVLANPFAAVMVVDPGTAAKYRLELEYLATETSGPLFESMKAKLAGIASHTGMQGVFRLLGADIYRVRDIAPIAGAVLPRRAERRNLLSAVRRLGADLGACGELAELFDRTLAGLATLFGIAQGMLLMFDETGGRLYTVASLGYAASGIGSEVALGDGVIGVAARERTPIRITHMTTEYSYGRAARESARRSGVTWAETTAIPFPGLEAPASQLAVPIAAGGRLLGVLFAESAEDMAFGYDDEDALAVVAGQLGMMIEALCYRGVVEDPPAVQAAIRKTGKPVLIRHYPADDSVFIDHDYLIKGVAGAIFWRLVREHVTAGRTEFSNRELRLAPELRLPEASENLEARLILLERRLAERCGFIRIEKTGRGRFRLAVSRPLALDGMATDIAG